jgi:predicted MFS family arabinose efflux permease
LAEYTRYDEHAAAATSPDLYSRDFWLVFAATFALNVGLNFMVLFPVFIVRLGGHATTIGAVVASAGLAALLMRPGATWAVDRRGRRWTAIYFLALSALAALAYIPVHSLGWPIYAVTALNGAANGTARVALFAMVYPLLPPGREGQAMAIMSLSGQGPASFGALLALRALQGVFIPGVAAVTVAYAGDRYPPARLPQVVAGLMGAAIAGGLAGRVMSGPVTAVFGWRATFLVSAALTALAALGLARELAPSPAPRTVAWRAAYGGVLAHLRDRRLVGAFLIGACLFFGWMGLFTYLPYHLTSPRYRLPTALVSSVYLVYAAGVVASPIAGRLARCSQKICGPPPARPGRPVSTCCWSPSTRTTIPDISIRRWRKQ